MKLVVLLLCLLTFVRHSHAACATGQYDDDGTCKNCGANTYSDTTTATSCTPCATGLYSGTKATSCSKCIKGYYPLGTATNGCEKCAKGYYKDTDGTATCTQCPADAGGTITTTSRTGSTAKRYCSACPAGYFKSANICTKCPAGYYGTDGSTCTKCTGTKSNSYTTGEGSSSTGQCLCNKGYSYTSSTVCTICAAGTYKDAISDASTCTSCTSGTTTTSTGATASTDCVCSAGYYKSSTMSSCAKCATGYYSASGASACTKCATGTSTTADGQSTCVCDKGYYGFENQCNPCPKGYYKTSIGSLTNGDTTTYACTMCPNGPTGTALTTASTGATASTDCIVECAAGKYGSSTTCADCALGTYQPNANQKECLSCGGTGYTTAAIGKMAHTDCQCAVGFYGTYSKCTSCPKGTYQDTAGQSACKQCDNDKVTTAVASTASSACIDEPSGSQSYFVKFTIINLSWTSNYDTESHADFIALKLGITAALEPVFEGITVGVSVVYYGTKDWDFSEGSVDVKFDAVFSNDDLDSDQIENAIKNSLSGINQLAGSSYQLDPDSISVTEDDLEWYVILAIVLGSLVVLGLFIVIIVLCVMYLRKEDRRRDYPQHHYGDRDRMMHYDNRARGRDLGVINRGGPYPPGTGFDERKDAPAMFPRPNKNMWQLQNSGWSPRNEIYGGDGAPYGSSSPYYKKPYGQDDHLY